MLQLSFHYTMLCALKGIVSISHDALSEWGIMDTFCIESCMHNHARTDTSSLNCCAFCKTFQVLIAIERERVVEKEAETTKKMAISEAEKNANVSKILMEQKLMEKDSARRQQEIENQMYLAYEKSLADAAFYR